MWNLFLKSDINEPGLPRWLSGKKKKNPSANAGPMGSIPGSGRSPGEGNGNPLQYSCLENPMDRGACGLQFMELQKRHNLATKLPPP